MKHAVAVAVGGLGLLAACHGPAPHANGMPAAPVQAGWVLLPVELTGEAWLDPGSGGAVLQAPAASQIRQALEETGRSRLHLEFAFDQTVLTAESLLVLEQVLGVLNDDPALRLAVEGRANGCGPDEDNHLLSLARARSVVAHLVAAGVSAERLLARGMPSGGLLLSDTSADLSGEVLHHIELVRISP